MSWTTIIVIAVGAYFFKAIGVLGGARLTTPLATRAITLLPAALFAAVVIVQTFERNAALVLDARAVGLVVAVIATWRKLPFVVIIFLAMVATAIARLI